MLKVLEDKGYRRRLVTQASTAARLTSRLQKHPRNAHRSRPEPTTATIHVRAPARAAPRVGIYCRCTFVAKCATRQKCIGVLRDQIAKLNGSAKAKARSER